MTDLENVSRETEDRLRAFVDLVLKWTPRINLISRSTIDDIWERHILDSLQVAFLGNPCKNWVDIGSGGGFPGLVVAIYAREYWPETHFTLIESDQRKCTFLRTAIRELDLNATVLTQRIELAPPQSADIISARALADLDGLLAHLDRHLAPDGYALLQKGSTWQKEVENARQAWKFQCEPITSLTNDSAIILKIRGVSRD